AADVTIIDAAPGTNIRPVASSQTITTSQGAAVNLVLGASDAETAPSDLIYNVPQETANGGSITGQGQFRKYTPSTGFTGTDQFTFTVTDRGNPSGCAFNEITPCP